MTANAVSIDGEITMTANTMGDVTMANAMSIDGDYPIFVVPVHYVVSLMFLNVDDTITQTVSVVCECGWYHYTVSVVCECGWYHYTVSVVCECGWYHYTVSV